MTINDLLEQGITIQAGKGIKVVTLCEDEGYTEKVLYEGERAFTEWDFSVMEEWADRDIKFIYPWEPNGIMIEVC